MHSRVLALLRGSSHGWSRKCRKSKSSKSSGEHPCCGQTSFSSWPEVVASGLEPFGADRDPVQPLGQGQRAVALHAKLEPEGVQAIDKLAGELQGRFAAREHDVGLCARRRLGDRAQERWRRWFAPVPQPWRNPGIRADEIRVAEPAFRRGPILRAARPEVAPEKRQNTAGRPACAPSPCNV